MTGLATKVEHVGETCGCADHVHDLVHDLSKRLDALWRYDQYIANAEARPALPDAARNSRRVNRIGRTAGSSRAERPMYPRKLGKRNSG